MAAGDNIAVTAVSLSAMNTPASISDAFTSNAATADTDALKQPYTFTFSRGLEHCVILIKSTGSGADGNLTYSITKGANVFAAGTAKTGTITKNTTVALQVDGRYTSATGTVVIEITPASTDKCLTDHALTVAQIELMQ